MENQQQRVTVGTVLTAAFLIFLSEALLTLALAPYIAAVSVTAVTRIVQTGMLLLVVTFGSGSIRACGLSPADFPGGVTTGVLWSCLFGAAVLGCAAVLFLAGSDPLQWIETTLPENRGRLLVFLVTGGLVSPVSEELFFRGILYTYLRKFGIVTALSVSTLLFAASHFPDSPYPFFQLIGGAVFALSFEKAKSLAAPIIIHMAGNLAIFSLNLV